jgi:putative sterol carrier protein
MSPIDLDAYIGRVGNMSDEEVSRILHGDRDAILDEIVRRMQEHFVPERAEGLEAVVAWRILDRPEGGADEFHMTIAGGRCSTGRGQAEDPAATISIRPVEFVRLVSGTADGMLLFSLGKLQVEGDLVTAARIPQLFDFPSA